MSKIQLAFLNELKCVADEQKTKRKQLLRLSEKLIKTAWSVVDLWKLSALSYWQLFAKSAILMGSVGFHEQMAYIKN